MFKITATILILLTLAACSTGFDGGCWGSRDANNRCIEGTPTKR